MYKDEYLSSRAVKDFMSWLEPILDTPQSFLHSYVHKKHRKTYTFDNLFAAYKKYDWVYLYTREELSAELAKSIVKSDEHACENACCEILRWGGVFNRGNKGRISRLAPNLCAYLSGVRERLALDLPSHELFVPGMHMTSGFSKIYAAFIDGYMIYDSRVGAALGLLVRTFCMRTNISCVPRELRFSWAGGLESKMSSVSRRNPSRDGYEFPELLYYRPDRYLENNMRANWLMSAVASATKSEFAGIEEPFRLRAMEQALFMMGYDVSQPI